MTEDQKWWIDAYRQKDALWMHDGNPKRPHALLASGQHSDGFFNSRLVIPDDELMRKAASNLVAMLIAKGAQLSTIDGVVGPQTGATKLAKLLSEEITRRTGRSCFWASPAKSENDGDKAMIFSEEDLPLLKRASVMFCEDVVSTGGSVGLAADAVSKAGGISISHMLALVNRSGATWHRGRETHALITRPMPMWLPRECPTCKQGSVAVRPKDNWALLNAEY